MPAKMSRERSTLSDWVGRPAAILEPLVSLLREEVVANPQLHAGDMPVPVLAPGMGKTRSWRLWVYVRDERPHGGETPPAAATVAGLLDEGKLIRPCEEKVERPTEISAFRGARPGNHAETQALLNWLQQELKGQD